MGGKKKERKKERKEGRKENDDENSTDGIIVLKQKYSSTKRFHIRQEASDCGTRRSWRHLTRRRWDNGRRPVKQSRSHGRLSSMSRGEPQLPPGRPPIITR